MAECTSLRIVQKDEWELNVVQYHANINIQLNTALVLIEAEFIAKKPGSKVLEFPIGSNVTVTNCRIETRKRTIATCVLSEGELTGYASGHPKFHNERCKLEKTLFYLPFEIGRGEHSIAVTLEYMYTMPFDAETNRYTFTLPGTFREPQHMQEASIRFSVNSACPSQYVQYGSASHKFKHINDVDAWQKGFEVEGWENRDFDFSYSIMTNEILGNVMSNNVMVDMFDSRATFCVNLHPPPDSQLTNGSFGRRIVFLIDISGSMRGDPIAQAKNALQTSLSQMRHFWDHFTIIAFNSAMFVFAPTLVEANPASVQGAVEWLVSLEASGGTDILTAVQTSAKMLGEYATAGDNRLPMVFLLTDGAVENEKAIYQYIVGSCQNIRFHTLGIGDNANAYFLKMIAMAGRGLNDHIVNYKLIFKQVLNLMRACTTPILTNIEVLLPVASSAYEIFPYPVPDLFCGHPLMISGKVQGGFDHVLVRGMLPNGQVYQQQFRPNLSSAQLHKVFAKQRLDYMVGQAWASGISTDVNPIVRMSTLYGIPTPYTVMVAYQKKPKRRYTNEPVFTMEHLILASVGSVILLTGLAFTFGDIASTAAGIINLVANPVAGPGYTLQANDIGDCCCVCCNCCDRCCDACCCCCYNSQYGYNSSHHRHYNTNYNSFNDGGCCYPYYGNGYYYSSGGSGNNGGCCDCCNGSASGGHDSGCCDCCNSGGNNGGNCECCNCCHSQGSQCNCCDGCCACQGDDCNGGCCGCNGGCDDCCKDCDCNCGSCCDCDCDCKDCDCDCKCDDCGGCDCNC